MPLRFRKRGLTIQTSEPPLDLGGVSRRLRSGEDAGALSRATDELCHAFPWAATTMWPTRGGDVHFEGAQPSDRYAATLVARAARSGRSLRDPHRGRLAVPVVGAEGVLGVFLLQAQSWNDYERMFIEALAREAAAAIDEALLRASGGARGRAARSAG